MNAVFLAGVSIGYAQQRVSRSDFRTTTRLFRDGDTQRVTLGEVQGRSGAAALRALTRAAEALRACQPRGCDGYVVVRASCDGRQCRATTESSTRCGARISGCVEGVVARAMQSDATLTASIQTEQTGVRIPIGFGTESGRGRIPQTEGAGREPPPAPEGNEWCNGGVMCGVGCCFPPESCGDSQCRSPEEQRGQPGGH